MSGHNKWSKIKRQKEKTDSQKSKIFGKMVRLITVEAKKAGGNVNSPGLKSAIERARDANVPNDNIERAIKKFSTPGVEIESVTYEAYGPGGCAMIIEALTDNRNKAAQEIKFILSKHGCELAGIGAANWAFERTPAMEWKSKVTIPLSDEDSQKLEELVDELEENDEVQSVYTNIE
ncbi:MAG: YebC/PmpR family DNA-binding transcriptional regulator [Candidatus Zambryskibacteria bacterium]|nr:YebC/PmpR family DNA-binding transcriptional regulator [Candidatus Zambryskibacteria bacterium]